MSSEFEITLGSDAKPSVDSAALTVYSLLGAPESPDMSLALIFLHGGNRKVRNLESDARYMVLMGTALFILLGEQGNEVREVVAGESIKILAGQWYQDVGHAAMVSLNHEAFNPAKVEAEESDQVVIAGSKVTLSKFAVSDAVEIFNLIDSNREHLSQYEEETAGKYPTLKKVVESLVRPNNRRHRYAIRDEAGGYVGTINLETHQNNSHIAEVGYYLGFEHQGHGYMVDAVNTLTAHAFNDMDIRLMYGLVHPDNIGSQKVLERAGYVYSRNQRVEHDGHYVSCRRYEKRRAV